MLAAMNSAYEYKACGTLHCISKAVQRLLQHDIPIVMQWTSGYMLTCKHSVLSSVMMETAGDASAKIPSILNPTCPVDHMRPQHKP